MRTGASLGWRIAAVAAFGATAALAVVLSRGVSMNAALASANSPNARHVAAKPHRPLTIARCTASGLRISLGSGTRVSTATTTYPLDFTNVSGAPCVIAGYPEVAAYRGDGAQVGAAAGQEPSAEPRVLLGPGQTAHASLDAAMPGARCGPVRVTGLRVVLPGQAAARYVRRSLTACTAREPRGQNYMRVRAVQPGAGIAAGAGTVAEVEPAPDPSRPAGASGPA